MVLPEEPVQSHLNVRQQFAPDLEGKYSCNRSTGYMRNHSELDAVAAQRREVTVAEWIPLFRYRKLAPRLAFLVEKKAPRRALVAAHVRYKPSRMKTETLEVLGTMEIQAEQKRLLIVETLSCR